MRASLFPLLTLWLAWTLPAFAQETSKEINPETEWAASIEKILSEGEKQSQDAEDVKAGREVRTLLKTPRVAFEKNESLEGAWKVRSLQVSNLGAFAYPFFSGRIYKEGQVLMFHKNTGSQRKIGVLKADGGDRYGFLGSEYIWDEKPTQHSSMMKDPTDKDRERNCEGALLKLGKGRCLLIFAPKSGRGEIYELKR